MAKCIFWFFLILLWYKIILADHTTAVNDECSSPNLNDRVSKLEAKYSYYEEEISALKTTVHELKGQVLTLEVKKIPSNDVINNKAKRPARLLPLNLFRREKNNTANEENEWEFEGPPTSCNTLAKLGYTLNGYYLINGKDQQSKSNVASNKIQIVYCRFKQFKIPGQKLQQMNFETMVGNVEVKTKSVHFYVQRNSSNEKRGILRFELVRLNVGGAMNLSTGIFTVPLNGIYHFEFSSVRSASDELAIYLQVNGVRVASSYSQVNTMVGGGFVTGVLNASFRLRRGDRVNLFKEKGLLMDNDFFYTHFTGLLVEEDLILP